MLPGSGHPEQFLKEMRDFRRDKTRLNAKAQSGEGVAGYDSRKFANIY